MPRTKKLTWQIQFDTLDQALMFRQAVKDYGPAAVRMKVVKGKRVAYYCPTEDQVDELDRLYNTFSLGYNEGLRHIRSLLENPTYLEQIA